MTWTGTAIVHGEAAAQGSKRIVRAGGTGRPMLADDDRRLKSWRGQLQASMLQCAPPEPIDAPIMVKLLVYVPRPRAHYGTGKNAGVLKPHSPLLPVSGKDLDKIARAVGDAGTGIWWRDDSRICQWSIGRIYSSSERVEVQACSPRFADVWSLLPVEELSPPDAPVALSGRAAGRRGAGE